MVSLFARDFFVLVLDVTKENVVEHRDGVDVQDAVLQWNEEEVDELRWRPNQPVSQIHSPEFLLKQFVGFFQWLPSKEEGRVEVVHDEDGAHDYLEQKIKGRE